MNLDLGHTRDILAVCGERGLLRNQAAYVLATAYWESGRTMKPVREAFGKSANDSIARLDRAFAAGKLPWVSKPYWRKDANGQAWFGRGLIQITFRENYARAGGKLGLDLTTDPDAVMKPDVAVVILVRGMMEGWFTAHSLPDHVNSAKTDYRNARRVVNGTDKAAAIAELAREYEAALEADGYGVKPPAYAVNSKNPDDAPRDSAAKSSTIQAAAGQAAAGIGAAASGIAALDGTAQTIAIVGGLVVVALAVWIMRERLRHWAAGVR